MGRYAVGMPSRSPFRRCLFLALIAAVAAGAIPAAAQTAGEMAALRKELDSLKAGYAALRKDVDDIKAAMKPAPQRAIMDAPPGLTVSLADAPSRGAATARVVLLEFSDFECPYCGRFFNDAFPAINREFIQAGRVRHVFRAFPLESIHKNAFKAHEAAACAGDQNQYWPMHDRLFANQRALSPADLAGHARALGLNVAAFRTCLESGKMTARVRKDVDAGTAVGVQGTPLFLIGTVARDGQLVVKKGISGAQPFGVFKQAIEDVLAGK